MNHNGKTKTLSELVEASRADHAIDIIGGNGHVEFDGYGEFDESDPRSVAFMLRLSDAIWPRNPHGKKYLTFTELVVLKENLFAALRHKVNPAARMEIENAKRIVLAALGEIESEQ